MEPQIHQNIGFDRLVGLGLSQEEVDVFRRHFHMLRNTYDSKYQNIKNKIKKKKKNLNNYCYYNNDLYK